MAKLYGNLINRLEEGRNLKPVVGMDITQYFWSDRKCLFITKVVDDKHIFVRYYNVVANQREASGMGHQDWLYFKSNKEQQQYINDCVKEGLMPDYCYHDINEIKESGETELVYRYNNWYKVIRKFYDIELEKPRYEKVSLSFGIRDYYYDWEF